MSATVDPMQERETYPGSTQDTLHHSVGATSSETTTNDTTTLANAPPIKSEKPDIPPPTADSDNRSDASFDPLFDGDDGDLNLVETEPSKPEPESFESKIAMPGQQNFASAVPEIPPPRPTRPSTNVAAPKNAPPLLDPANYATFSPDLLLTASIDGQVILWDRRAHAPKKGVGRLSLSEKTPPWCLSVSSKSSLSPTPLNSFLISQACWSADGSQIYAGRRNGVVDVWDVRLLGHSGPLETPRLLKTLRNPSSSGVVSCVVAFPDSRHIAW